jgi:hypothetical protein
VVGRWTIAMKPVLWLEPSAFTPLAGLLGD